MTKESIYELQRIDCNCNDCFYLNRDTEAYEHSKTLHHLWQRQYFDLLNRKKLEKAEWWLNVQDDYKKAKVLIDEVNNAKFQFKNDAHINFGHCNKFDKSISFIPATCQLETQHCFIHRKDIEQKTPTN